MKKNIDPKNPYDFGTNTLAFKGLLIVAIVLIIIPFVKDFTNGHYIGSNSSVTSSEYTIRYQDDASLLSDPEKASLSSLMVPLLSYGHAGFYTTTKNADSTESMARSTYRDWFGIEDGVLIVIDMDNREIYIRGYGYVADIITNTTAVEITDNAYRYASNGDYYACAKEMVTEIDAMLSGKEIPHTMKHISNFLLAFAISVLAVFLYALKKTKLEDYSPLMFFHNNHERANSLELVKYRLVREYKTRISSASYSSGSYSSGSHSSGSHSSGSHSYRSSSSSSHSYRSSSSSSHSSSHGSGGGHRF